MKLKDYFKKAQKEKWAIGQFNFSTLEQLRGILKAGEKMKSPLILGTSEGESRFLGLREIVALFEIAKTEYDISAFLNLDHGKNLKWIKEAVDYGYDAVHFDGSDLSYKNNIKKTKEVVSYAHKKGVLVEGELGKVTGSSAVHKGKSKIKREDLTSPTKVKEFVKETGVDSLAVAIGNIHGVFKKMPELDFERLKEIRKKSDVFLVLHGASGIAPTDIKKAIRGGMVKININTELRIAWKEALKGELSGEGIKPYNILPSVQLAVQKKVEEKMKLFDSKGKVE